MSDHDDLVKRLNDPHLWQRDELEYIDPLCKEAAAAIIALQGKRDEARKKAGKLHDYANMRDAQVTDLSAEVARLKVELAEAHQVIDALDEALSWCSGSTDFQTNGHAREGWMKVAVPALNRARSFRDGQKTGEKG